MKKFVRLSLAVSIGVILCISSFVSLRLVSAAPVQQPPGGAKYLLVADFEDDDWTINVILGEASCWGSDSATIICEQVIEDSHRGVLKMTYDVSQNPDAFALYSSGLNGLNASTFDSVWVSLKGAVGGEKLYIELKDCGLHGSPLYPKVEVDDYLSQGISSTMWSGVNIPLTAFEAITDFSCLDQVNVLAHNKIGSGQGTVFIDDIRMLSSSVLVDDFHDQLDSNELGGDSGYWNEPEDGDHIQYNFPDGELKLEYDVAASVGISEAIYWTSLRNTRLVATKNALTFDIRGEQGQEQAAIEFRDCGLDGERHIPKVKISDYLPRGITTAKQGVSIPLAAFGREIDWSCIESLNILVSSRPQFNSQEGAIYVDNIELSNQSAPRMVDNFSDCNDWNAMLRIWTSGVISNASIDPDLKMDDQSSSNGCGYHLTYEVKTGSATWVASDLGGIDVSKYTHLSFRIKGSEGNEEPHVYLGDISREFRYFEDVRPTKNWKEVRIPLEYFGAAVDLHDLTEFKIAFEWKSMSGMVMIDDIRFINDDLYLPIIRTAEEVTHAPPPPLGCEDGDDFAPNNTRSEAEAALISGQAIQSKICGPEDKDDYFIITVTKSGKISVRLTNIADDVDYDLYLYKGLGGRHVARSNTQGSVDEKIHYSVQEGAYFVRVYPYSLVVFPQTGFSQEPYTLEATFE